jgi:V-type H+-transporting ATPase subunit a
MNILVEFIPQIIFLVFIFVYLCVMIFIKWLKFSGAPSQFDGPNCAPNLLIGLNIQNLFYLFSLLECN